MDVERIYWGVLSAILLINNVTICQPFYIYFERTGGFTGITNEAEIHSDSLQQEECERLLNLINYSGFFETQKSYNIKGDMPDQFQYKITIEYNDKRQTLELGDAAIPESLRPLIQYLSRKARPVKK